MATRPVHSRPPSRRRGCRPTRGGRVVIRQASFFLLACLLLAACAREPVATGSASGPSAPAAQTPVLPMIVAPSQTPVLSEVTITAEGLPPERTVALAWVTVDGGWNVADYYRFL